jgi:hypothetical protein
MNQLGRVGSDTESRLQPVGFCPKNWDFTNLFASSTYSQAKCPDFDRFFFARLKAEFNPHFRGFFGTNWDKSLASALEACAPKRV